MGYLRFTSVHDEQFKQILTAKFMDARRISFDTLEFYAIRRLLYIVIHPNNLTYQSQSKFVPLR